MTARLSFVHKVFGSFSSSNATAAAVLPTISENGVKDPARTTIKKTETESEIGNVVENQVTLKANIMSHPDYNALMGSGETFSLLEKHTEV